MYKARSEQRLNAPTIDKPIRNCGWFEPGIYQTWIHVDTAEYGLRFTFTDITGNTHTEVFHNSFTERRWRSALLPSLQCQQLIDDMLGTDTHNLCKALSKLKAVIEVDLTEGYRVVRESGQYCAMDGTNQLTPWMDQLSAVKALCRKNKYIQSLHRVVEISGHRNNEAEFLAAIKGDGSVHTDQKNDRTSTTRAESPHTAQPTRASQPTVNNTKGHSNSNGFGNKWFKPTDR